MSSNVVVSLGRPGSSWTPGPILGPRGPWVLLGPGSWVLLGPGSWLVLGPSYANGIVEITVTLKATETLEGTETSHGTETVAENACTLLGSKCDERKSKYKKKL